MNPVMKQKFLNQYKATSIETGLENASPHKLVAMLYEGALDALALVKGAIERKDFEMKARKINQATNIISALRIGLDTETGGEATKTYEELYGYINRQILHVTIKNDLVVLDEVMSLVRELKDSWNMMPNNMKALTKEQLDNLKKVKA